MLEKRTKYRILLLEKRTKYCKFLLEKRTKYCNFLLENDNEIIPLEVKSGKDYQRHVALKNILSNEEYAINRAIVLCNENIQEEGHILYAPVYMTMFLHHRPVEAQLIYHPELP